MSKRRIVLHALLLAVFLVSSPAYAKKKKTIILRAAGSGALLGLGAGLISYPFAKSTGTILAGAFVGAALGTVYGFHLASERERAYRDVNLEGGPRMRMYDPNLEERPLSPVEGRLAESNPAITVPWTFVF
jgi:hypothetical protein